MEGLDHMTVDEAAIGTPWRMDSVFRVTDGDTVRVVRSRPYSLDGRHYRLTDDPAHGTALRLVWVDTPERGDHPGWENARQDLTNWLNARAPGTVTAICYESGGWDRLMADLIDADGNSASQWLMIERGWPPFVRG